MAFQERAQKVLAENLDFFMHFVAYFSVINIKIVSVLFVSTFV